MTERAARETNSQQAYRCNDQCHENFACAEMYVYILPAGGCIAPTTHHHTHWAGMTAIACILLLQCQHECLDTSISMFVISMLQCIFTTAYKHKSTRESQSLLDLSNGERRVQSLRACPAAVQDCVASVQAHAVVQVLLADLCLLIS